MRDMAPVRKEEQAAEPAVVLPDRDKLKLIGEELSARLKSVKFNMIELQNEETAENIRRQYPAGPLCVCDLHIMGAEEMPRVTGGFRFENADILLIDHHAPHKDMYRFISSGNLACQYVREKGPAAGYTIINNHYDCDSVISRLIMGGELPPHEIFESAVIAADHTGNVHPVADLLQALDPADDMHYSARNLALLLRGEPVEPSAQKLVARRHRSRQLTADWIKDGNVELTGNFAVVHLGDNMRNEFLPALLPDAAVILTVEPGKGSQVVARLRLGTAAPAGFNLTNMNMKSIDPNYGGRWNAGSNRRGGGTDIPESLYVKLVASDFRNAFEKFKAEAAS